MLISKDINQIAKALTENDVVAIPTETVYVLAANIYSKEAINRIYSLKKRPKSNPLIVHISGFQELDKYVQQIPDRALKLAKAFWPGPLTLLLDKSDLIPDYILLDLIRLR